MATLDTAISIACRAHAGQKDKAGKPYILHVVRVVLGCSTEEEQIVAALHDVLEDCPDFSESDLVSAGFSQRIVNAVDALTRRSETYTDYLLRLSDNQLACRVKLADLRDNLDRSRIPNPTGRDLTRWEKYEEATKLLLGPRATQAQVVKGRQL